MFYKWWVFHINVSLHDRAGNWTLGLANSCPSSPSGNLQIVFSFANWDRNPTQKTIKFRPSSAVPPTQKRAPDKNGSPNGCANRIRDEGTAHHLMDNGYGFVWKGCLLIHWFTIMFNKKHHFMVKKTSSDRPCMVIHPRMGMGNLPRSWPRNKWYFVWPLRCWSSKISANYA